jgi:hypothetical protein
MNSYRSHRYKLLKEVWKNCVFTFKFLLGSSYNSSFTAFNQTNKKVYTSGAV